MQIKNWQQFQHYKNRRPPWIKLYRDLLDDPEWHELDGDSAKILVMLWLIASDDNKTDGKLPAIKKLAFRLRMTERQASGHIINLAHWIEYDASEVLADCNQVAIPETETETETEGETEKRHNNVRSKKRIEYPPDFEKLWKLYPATAGSKKEAYADFKKADIGADEMAVAIHAQIRYRERLAKQEKFVPEWPHLCRWIKKERWNDKLVSTVEREALEKFTAQIRKPDGTMTFKDYPTESDATRELTAAGYSNTGAEWRPLPHMDGGVK